MTFVYLDESGDCGFKFRKGSSRYFVVSLLLVEDPVPLHSEIDRLRHRMGFTRDVEFKFSHSANHLRTEILGAISKQPHQIRALVVDKKRIVASQVSGREPFYDYVVGSALADDKGTIRNATIILDESVRNKRQQLITGTRLRKAINQPHGERRTSKIYYHKSHSDYLVQAVDMICGAIYRRYEKSDPTFFRLIEKNVQEIREWPPE